MSEHIEQGWIQTASGRRLNLLAPRPEDIDPYDIAWSLAHQCRFAGHVRSYYSVAQHSVLVSQQVPREHALAALLHDAAEAGVTDVPRPIKRAILQAEGPANWLALAERRLQRAIFRRFGVSYPWHECVDQADRLLLVTEARDLMSPLHPDWHYCERNGYPVLSEKITPLGPMESFALFAQRWCELTGDLLRVFDREARAATGWRYPLEPAQGHCN